MNQDFSASKSQQTGTSTAGSTPFDAIVTLEEQEEKRIQKELASMQEEENAEIQACQKKEVEAEQELKTTAKAELKEYREKELSPILKKGEKDAQEHCKKLEDRNKDRADTLAIQLAEQLLNEDSSLAA